MCSHCLRLLGYVFELVQPVLTMSVWNNSNIIRILIDINCVVASIRSRMTNIEQVSYEHTIHILCLYTYGGCGVWNSAAHAYLYVRSMRVQCMDGTLVNFWIICLFTNIAVWDMKK